LTQDGDFLAHHFCPPRAFLPAAGIFARALERLIKLSHALERLTKRCHALERLTKRCHALERLIKRCHALERLIKRCHALERLIKRCHAPFSRRREIDESEDAATRDRCVFVVFNLGCDANARFRVR
jgi:hypothetical protein